MRSAPQRFRATFDGPTSTTVESIRRLHGELAETILDAQDASGLTSVEGALVLIVANHPEQAALLAKFAAAGCDAVKRDKSGAVAIAGRRENIASALSPNFARLLREAPPTRQVSINFVPGATVAIEVERANPAPLGEA